MNEYTSLLEQVAERADPTTLPDPSRIRAAVTRRRTRAAGIAAVAAIAVTAAGGIALANRPTSQSPAPPVNTPTPTPSPAPPSESFPSTYGEPVTVEPGLDYFDISSVAYLGARGGGTSVYVVVGDTSGTFDGPRPTPPIWWSPDARTWHHATTGPDFPNVWDVATYDGRLVAVAPKGLHHSTAWYSTDGDRWLRVDVPADFHAFAVSPTRNGLFAWSDDAVFASPDGRHWSDVASAPDPSGGRICFVQDVAGQTVLGAVSHEESPLAWVLEGGRWTSRPSLAAGEDAKGWCARHETPRTSTVGPAGTVTIRPLESIFDTVFVKADQAP